MVACQHLPAVPGCMNSTAALCFLWVNMLCWLRHQHHWFYRLEGCRRLWNEFLAVTVAFIEDSEHQRMALASPLKACAARGQQEQKEEEAHGPAEIYAARNGAEEAGQTSDKGTICVETGSSPHFLQLPLPPDIEGDNDPH